MDAEIKEYQDKNVSNILKLKELQIECGYDVGIRFSEERPFVPVDYLLRSLLRTTTRKDLQEKIDAVFERQPFKGLPAKGCE